MVSPVLGTAARLVTNGDASWYRAPALSICPEIVHGVTHASLGNFSLSTADDPAEVEARRQRLLRAAELSFARLVAPPLTHSAAVGVVDGGKMSGENVDALVTDDVRTVLAVTVADCVPVFFVDAAGAAFGVAHAGWRGMAGGIVRRTVEVMQRDLGVKLGNLLVGAGPAIRGPHYEVGPDVAGLFPEAFSVPVGDPADGRAQVDLPSCALAQAAGAGVPRDNVVDFALSTFDRVGDLFSHRRGDRARHWAFIGRA